MGRVGLLEAYNTEGDVVTKVTVTPPSTEGVLWVKGTLGGGRKITSQFHA